MRSLKIVFIISTIIGSTIGLMLTANTIFASKEETQNMFNLIFEEMKEIRRDINDVKKILIEKL